MDAEDLYRQHLTHIDQIAASVCRRHGVNHHDAEDFASDIRLKLCENDYAAIRKFQGKSSFTTYLTVVINKAFLDHRRHLWGKWTPSTQAKRVGPVAIVLETLVYRDGCTFETACQVLEQKHAFEIDRRELRTVLAQLPRRAPRRFESDDDLGTLPSNDDADAPLLADERAEQQASAEAALRDALATLQDEDRAIIRMMYYEGMSAADVARGLYIDQKRLYPRIRQLLGSLRKILTERKISPDVLEALDSGRTR
jgi:RNA polymerase sigma factor for flagellar operon FliA